ncbi:MAG TPA: hypothetical protein DDW65_03235 [Firmicutes bacterium]|nr:hypothetical protein [Bacillota bacterium]
MNHCFSSIFWELKANGPTASLSGPLAFFIILDITITPGKDTARLVGKTFDINFSHYHITTFFR